jgi:hypothetical protein
MGKTAFPLKNPENTGVFNKKPFRIARNGVSQPRPYCMAWAVKGNHNQT